MYKAQIYITQREQIRDTAGNAVESALHKLDFTGVQNVRIGKYITFDLDAETEAAAKSQVEAMCKKLLANSTIEEYRIDINNEVGCMSATHCPCPSTSCVNYKSCCACVARHSARGNLPFCLRNQEEIST